MRTFELEKEINTVLKSNLTKEELLDHYAALGEGYIQCEVRRQALLESVSEVVNEMQAGEIGEKMTQKIDEHFWRHTPDSAKEELFRYGYQKPVVPINQEEAIKSLQRQDPVLLLFSDNTEKLAETEEEIKEHIKKGGLCANTQLTVDLEIDYILHEEEDLEYDDL